ncbi:MAG TPA: hypothetical protein PK867_06385, partial [Pirellulales bacterium]|nr:hypothetical protein [Pirellulales bacterium]
AAIDLEGLTLPGHAAVYLEAMCAGSTIVERFDCGQVGQQPKVYQRPLKRIDGENVFFTLKVVDRTERFGRILGIAENIRPQKAGKQTASGRRGILPIEPSDQLGHELWRLDFREQDVFLLVNKDIPELAQRASGDPLFYAAVYPQVVRTILMRAFEEGAEIDEDEDRWPVMWLRFGKTLHPDRETPPTGSGRGDEQQDWIDDVVGAFCETHSLKAKYLSALTMQNGGEA